MEVFTPDRTFHIRLITLGVFMVVYPLIITIRQLFHLGANSITLIEMYFIFFRKQLSQEDLGRQIAFYITLITNIVGLILIFTHLIIK